MEKLFNGTSKLTAPFIKLLEQLKAHGKQGLGISLLLLLLILLLIWSTRCSTLQKQPDGNTTSDQPVIVACSSNGYNAVYYSYVTWFNTRPGINLENIMGHLGEKGFISSRDKFLTAVKKTGNQALADIQGLTCLTNLDITVEDKGKITDISPLAKLVNLKFLTLPHADLRDISPLGHLSQLEYLSIDLEHPVDLTVLYGLKKLKELDVCGSWVDESCNGAALGPPTRTLSQYPKEFSDLLKALPQLTIRFGYYLNLSF
ncbi:MAG: hypothetical protein WC805_03580 [Patescibacteria group bacterium]|jgi:Leucine-rich repeat (LRR) protein